MKNLARIATWALTTLAFLALAVAAFGQVQTGTLRGAVTDPNGGVVANATVIARNQSTGATTPSVQTNGEGVFSLTNLVPGKYTLTVEQAGFKKKSVTDVEVALGAVASMNVALEVGAPSETVTVTSTGEELVNRDESQISTRFETRKIEELPSNGAGGGLDTLALLAPGVVAQRNGGVNTNGAGLAVNGNRARSNNFQIDGSDNNDLSIGGPSLFVDNQSQIAEYQVITNNFSAQYGRNSGSIVNIVTKQGGNDFHGDLFEYHQNWAHLSSLNNIERAAGQLRPNQNIYNTFGGTVGGPVYLPKFGEGGKSYWKGTDKAFFFFSYQGIRNPSTSTLRGGSLSIFSTDLQRLQTTFPGNNTINALTTLSGFAATNVGSVGPRTDLGSGTPKAFNLGALASGCPRAITVGSTAPAGCGTYTTYINPSTNAPFITGGPFDVFNFGSAAAPQLFQAAFAERNITEPFTENQWSTRFTVKPNSKDNIDFRFLKQNQLFANTGAGSNGFTYDVPATSRNLGGTWTRQISSKLVNEFKFTTQDLNVEFGGTATNYGIFSVPKPADIANTVSNISFGSFFGLTRTTTSLATIGPATNIPQGRLVRVYQFADTLSWVRGKHNLVIGAEYKHLTNKVPFLPSYQGVYTYSTSSALTRILNNAPSAFSVTAGNPITTYTENDQYYFIQDDFKIRSNLTLNLGLRYEYTGQPINQLHDATVKRESGTPQAIFDPSLPLSIRTIPFVPPDKNNFAPRFGFAYTPKFEHGFLHRLVGEDATVFRGGFAIAYDPAFYNILLNLQNVAPYSAALSLSSTNALSSTTTSPVPLPGNPIASVVQGNAIASGVLPLGKLNPLYLTQTTVSPNFRSPYSEQWSFGIQRQVTRSQVFEAMYVGTHGVGLFQNVNDNFFTGPMVTGIAINRLASGALQVNTGTPSGTTYVPGSGADCSVFTTPGACFTFPSFLGQLPSTTVAQFCPDDPTTLFVNESICNGRLKRQAGITMRSNQAQSIYHSLQARYAGRFMKNALSLNASYTFSKTIDNASEIFAFADISSANAQNPFCINSCERALSNLNRPHAFSLSFIYDVPFHKEQRGFVGHVLGGWQVNGVQVTTSGNPFTPNESTNGAYGLGTAYLTSGDRPFVANPNAPADTVAISAIDAFLKYGAPQVPNNSTLFYNLNTANQTGNWVPVSLNDVRFVVNSLGSAKIFGTPFGSMPRNYLHGPAINQLNASLFKNTKIGERLRLQLQATAINVLNHPNPGYGTNANGYLPNATLENAGLSSGGFNDRTQITYGRRVIQFGARLIF
jgi:outer membrane receptor protein involved in Fe transport